MRRKPGIIVPTAAFGTSNNQIASTAFVQTAVSSITPGTSPPPGIVLATNNSITGSAIKGDGVTNDAAAINTLLSSVASSGLGVYFPGNHVYQCGSASLTDPGGNFILCGPGAVFLRSADPSGGYGSNAASLLNLGNYTRWSGGTLQNSAVMGTSTTSIVWPIPLGSNGAPATTLTFTTQANLNIGPGTPFTDIRVWSNSHPGCGFEGTPTAYNASTGLVTFSTATASFFNLGGTPAGTYDDWNITIATVYQAGCVLHGTIGVQLSDMTVTGQFYQGILLDGWSTNSTLLVRDCSVIGCYLDSIQNRSISVYGNHLNTEVGSCRIEGNGVNDYGINCNAANSSAVTINNVLNSLHIHDNAIVSSNFQGVVIGDEAILCDCSNNSAYNIAAGNGFTEEISNNTGGGHGIEPAYNTWNNNIASSCQIGMEHVGTFYSQVIGLRAVSCGTGLELSNGTEYLKGTSISVQSSTGTGGGFGVVFGSGALRCVLDVEVDNCSNIGVVFETASSPYIAATDCTVTGQSINNTPNLVDQNSGSTGNAVSGLRIT